MPFHFVCARKPFNLQEIYIICGISRSDDFVFFLWGRHSSYCFISQLSSYKEIAGGVEHGMERCMSCIYDASIIAEARFTSPLARGAAAAGACQSSPAVKAIQSLLPVLKAPVLALVGRPQPFFCSASDVAELRDILPRQAFACQGLGQTRSA